MSTRSNIITTRWRNNLNEIGPVLLDWAKEK